MQIISISFDFWRNSRISLVWKSLKRWIYRSALIQSGVFFRKQDTAGRRSLFMLVNRIVTNVAEEKRLERPYIWVQCKWPCVSGWKRLQYGYDKAVCLFAWWKQSCWFCTTFQAQEHDYSVLHPVGWDTRRNDCEWFKWYLETDLLPHLNGNSVLIMDNMKLHHAKAVRNLLDNSGVRYIYLPPYSPNLNPIEKLWSKVKSFLRKFKARTMNALPNEIQCAFQTVSPSDCLGWFRSCRYWVQGIILVSTMVCKYVGR